MFSQQLIQGTFRGFSGLGDAGGGLSYALRGSVIDAVLNVGPANRVFAYTDAMLQSLKDNLNSAGFQIISIDGSNLSNWGFVGGGTIRVRAQINNDGYATANDAASVIAGAASGIGYNVTSSTGVLVAAPPAGQTTGPLIVGGAPGQTQTGQTYTPPPPGTPPGAPKSLADYLNDLTSSPTALAVIAGAAVLLVISMKK